MLLDSALLIADDVFSALYPHCERIEIAGSIRRKACSKCKTEKDELDFSIDKSRKDGRYPSCKKCDSDRNKERYKNNLEHNRAQKRAQAKKFRGKNIARSRKWYQENKERTKSNVSKYKKENKEFFRKYSNDWAKNNPEKRKRYAKKWAATDRGKQVISQRNRTRKARIRGAEGSYTMAEWELLKRQYGGLCVFCQRSEPEIKITADHIIPISKGGSNYISNIQPLCQSCNSSKHDKIIDRVETYLLKFTDLSQ